MKVYLAAPYSRKDQISEYAAELRAGGITVTSSWLTEPHKPDTQFQELPPEVHRDYALQDVKDVQAAEALVLFTDPTKKIFRAGRHVEFGIAVQRGIPILVVGKEYENIFHYLPKVLHLDTWADVRDLLIDLGKD
jgi:nucleoside 2-deoxyribosyltransferase